MHRRAERLWLEGPSSRRFLPFEAVAERAAWQVTETGWIYVVGDGEHAGGALLTLLVDDLGAWVAELGRRGIAPGTIDTVPGVGRKAVIADPDGNRITLAEPLNADH